MFGLNVRLDLSRKATTKSLSSLSAQPGFEILGESAGTVAVRVIRGDEGVCYVTVGTFTRRGLDSISNDTELSWFGLEY